MSDILLGVIVFSSVILLLVIILNVLGDILLPQGEVTLLINDDVDKSINVQTGGTVLSALAGQSVYLPSACGGQGTCAQCKCQVIEGGGDILPTEEAYISRSDQKDNWRLGCQVKIRNDMKIKVPDEIFSIRKWDATVKSNDSIKVITVRTTAFETASKGSSSVDIFEIEPPEISNDLSEFVGSELTKLDLSLIHI